MSSLLFLFLFPLMTAPGIPADTSAEPNLLSVFPLGGQAGKVFRATIRGRSLDAAHALWFPTEKIQARVLSIEEEPRDSADAGKSETTAATQLLGVEIQTDENLASGKRTFRVVSPGGISNPLEIYIHAEPALTEQDEAHERPRQAQALPGRPLAVHGRIDEVGQVDYYSFDAEEGELILFEAVSSGPLDPGIALYELTGSWFDENRATRLAYHDDDDAPYPGLSVEAKLTYRFDKAGNYLVRVGGFSGYGGAEHMYTLRMVSGGLNEDEKSGGNSGEAREWLERQWTRSLDQSRMHALWSRSVPGLAPSLEDDEGKPKEGAIPAAREIPIVDADAEPAQAPVVPPKIPLPALVVGTIERPGDIDRVSFSIKQGDRLVLEVETPEKTIPIMNPYLRVVDDAGDEAFTNVHSKIDANGNLGKQIQPKTAFSFSRDGEFTLEIRDITASYGDRDMQYRVLVRPQVPHMGEVHIAEDHVNLVAGEAKKLSVVTDQEEGYDGFVILSVEGLPEGVRAVPGTEVEPDAPPAYRQGKIERFQTKSQTATFVLLPAHDAPATRMPAVARVYAQPVADGKLGDRIPVKDLLVMVTQHPEAMSQNTMKQLTGASR